MSSTAGSSGGAADGEGAAVRDTTITTLAARNASGEAQRGASRCARAHTTITGATASGFAATPSTGPRHSWNSTPASIACAIGVGIRAISAPSAGTSPVSTISTPTSTNAPTAAGQPPSTAPVAASSAAPGVDQATVIGRRVRRESSIEHSPISTLTASSPLAACAGEAPTPSRPARTTTKELVNATRPEMIPAETGRSMSAD